MDEMVIKKVTARYCKEWHIESLFLVLTIRKDRKIYVKSVL